MIDRRNDTLAQQLVHYSLGLQKGEILYLEVKGAEALDLGKAIIKSATLAGAIPFWFYNDESLQRPWLMNTSAEQLQKQSELHLHLMQKADAYIGLRGSDNPFNLADIPKAQMKLHEEIFMRPVHMEERVKRTRWVVLRYPNDAMAQLAESSSEAFKDFYYDVCCAKYDKMSLGLDRLVQLMNATDKVHIKGPGTDLTFSIKGIGAIKCDGKVNVPDGEAFTAPVRESVNGQITYNAPSLREGVVYEDICFTFKNGKIVSATAAGNSEKLNEVLDIDDGARYVGEFALGVNPFILKPMKDTLFDEKIKGSLHFTPGSCYDSASNGNVSNLHWDLVLIQRKEYGGGEIWFDDKLIRKDGVFTDADLEYVFSTENLRG